MLFYVFDKCDLVEFIINIKDHFVMKDARLKRLGLNIKRQRKNIGLSQEKLAELLNKSRNYIGMVERAEINIPILSLFEFADALKIAPQELLTLD